MPVLRWFVIGPARTWRHPAADDLAYPSSLTAERVFGHIGLLWSRFKISTSYFITNWLVSTNHKRIAVMYFLFVITAAFSGLALATIIRVELAVPGLSFLDNNAEKYLTIISLHAIVMVFFVVIPVLFGAFGNFLLPTQLGVRDVAFPRLNSFMFWVTPSGFVLLMHIFLFDKSPSLPFETSEFPRHSTVSRGLLSSVSDIVEAIAEKGKGDSDIELVINIVSNWYDMAVELFDLVSDFVCTINRDNWAKKIMDIFIMPDKSDNYRISDELAERLVIEEIFLKGRAKPSGVGQVTDVTAQSVSSSQLSAETLPAWRSSEVVTLSNNAESISGSLNFAQRRVLAKTSSWRSDQLIPGWAFITPYSSRLRFSAVGKVDIALIVVFAAGLGSIFSAVNYVITYRCVSAPAFKNRRELRSFFADALLVGSRMMLAANPALLIAIVFLLCDRHLGTSIFDFSGGGDAVLFQHLFWFFGHPEVYIIVIPCFGFANSLLPHLLRKRLSGRLSLQYSMYTIGFMGFAVWGHHLYMVGLANTTRTLYSTMTVMISVPASTKVLHWCVTMVNSAPKFDVSLLFLIAFTYFFTLGGLSGMFNAHIGFDVSLHDTFYVIGHFHVMLAGAAVSCIFAAFYFYFGAIFGVRFSQTLGILHFVFYFFGQLFTIIPMMWLGYAGMPRRIMDYPAYFGGWHSIISGGHILSVIAFVIFIVMLVESFWEGRAPESRTLGVPRLNTRLSFYLYERRKLALCATRAAELPQAVSDELANINSESVLFTYTFESNS